MAKHAIQKIAAKKVNLVSYGIHSSFRNYGSTFAELAKS